MIRMPSGFFAFVLAATLALAGMTWAMARGHAPAVGEAVICTGTGMITIALDAEGNPTGDTHPCPDCIGGCGGLAVGTPTFPAALALARTALVLPAEQVPTTPNLRPAKARAPPAPV